MKFMLFPMLACFTCWADTNTMAKEETRRHISHAEMEQSIYKRTGGKLVRPGTMNGEIIYVNCQSSAPIEWIDRNAAYFRKQTKLPTKVTTGTFEFPDAKTQGNLSLFIIDDPALPSLLHAPESKWVMVNVAKLKDNARPQFFEARVGKELSRGFALLAGAQDSSYQGSLMGSVKSTEDLDKFINHKLPVDVLPRFATYVAGYGITPAIEVTYIQAVQEGWAPAPTNDVQKAIWDKVHAMPTEPLKIKPEEKKVSK